jgi:ABC-type maltose transport system permease subunit
MRSPLFQKFAGALAIGAGAGGIAYAIAFLVFLYNGSRGSKGAIALLLLLGGLATSAVLVALYDFVREVDPMFALWGLIIGVAGAIGPCSTEAWIWPRRSARSTPETSARSMPAAWRRSA